jgi:hypothetical protein
MALAFNLNISDISSVKEEKADEDIRIYFKYSC